MLSGLRRLARVVPSVPMYVRASRALRYAEQRKAPGTTFARFGRRLAIRLVQGGSTRGVRQLLLAPVSITRYFEFEFVLRNMPSDAVACLDVSSPRLFALFVAETRPAVSILMMNPDPEDAEVTRSIAERAGYANVAVSSDAVAELATQSGRYDCIWSISVVEHIAGDDGDTDAMRLMYAALRPGGRLIVTVPVDRRFWLEYRDRDYYGTHHEPTPSGQHFFQRFYDEPHLRSRLLEPLGREPTMLGWFGERVNGTFHAYIRRWIAGGPDETIEDPRRIADDYDSYESWEGMPGAGVCGMVIDRPRGADQNSTP